MDEAKKKILILTADAGFGHRSAANAIFNALENRYGDQCEIHIANPLEDPRTPFFLRDSQSDYDQIVKNLPEIYRLGYEASDALVPVAIVESALTVLMFEVMNDLINQQQPDAIVSTYPLYQEPIASVFSIRGIHIPFYTVVTDLATVHGLWFNTKVDGCLVPTETVRNLAIANRVHPDKITITGIPVNPQFGDQSLDKEKLREKFGWRPDMPTFLAVGSPRVERLFEAIHVLNHFGSPVQIAVVAGKNKELYQKVKEMEWHTPIHLYEYSNQIPEMMHASDAIICKAGGLIVTEALACGLPMMLVDVLPGQETGNADFVVQGGAGALAQTAGEMIEVISHWLMDGCKQLALQAGNARRLGRPNAAIEIADLLWQAAQRGPHARHEIIDRTRLLNLLEKNNIQWKLKIGKRFSLK